MTNALTTTQLLTRLDKRLNELGAWRDARMQSLAPGQFLARSGEAHAISVGEVWPSRDFPVTLKFQTAVPGDWQGPLALRIDLGGEGLLSVNGVHVGGLNPYHHEYRLSQATPGQALSIEIVASPRDLMGRPARRPLLKVAALVQPDLQVRSLHDDLAAALSAARHLLVSNQSELAEQLADALDSVFQHLPLERGGSAAYLARAVRDAHQAEQIDSIWEEWDFGTEDLSPFPGALRPALQAAQTAWHIRKAELLLRYPPLGSLALTGHAHIDLAWLWPLAETRHKALRTFSTVLSLMDQYPEYTFNQSTAQLYRFVEEDAPELFTRIKARVAEGRWDVVGGMWVEPDGNLPSGESWSRQLLHGQRYFLQHFGRQAQVCWLPDTFGYAANLPQLLNLAGIQSFFTTKLNWNETNRFPYDLYHWEGLDGSRVLAHSFYNPHPASGYNGDIAALDVLQTWANFRGKRFHDQSLLSFGYGDGGGGPTFEMLERFARLKEFPGLPKLTMRRVEDFYAGAAASVDERLPTWVGEQYLELHRGTYTSQARVKAFNRRLEHTLVEAEAASTLAWKLLQRPYPRAIFETLWQTLLRNQFHDILPGSSVKAVYDVAHQELGEALSQARTERDQALQTLSDAVASSEAGGTERVIVWNLSPDDKPLRAVLATAQNWTLSSPAGEAVHTESVGDTLQFASELRVPSLGYVTLHAALNTAVPGGKQLLSPGDDLTLENELLRVVVSEDGTLASLFDKRLKREMLAGRGNQIWLYTDLAREWDAWEVDASYAQEGTELLTSARPERQPGTMTQAIRVQRQSGESRIVQTYRLTPGSARLDIVSEVEWHGRHGFLRSLNPISIRSPHATFETAFGSVMRTTHTNTSWDAAQFEVPGHRWADLSDGACGVSLLNDSKYGYSAKGQVLGLSLLRSPVYPDPTADEGLHCFTYALYPHAGDWRRGTLAEAHDLNAPLLAVRSAGTGGPLATQDQFLSLPAGVRLSALKLAEDSDVVVLRVYEPYGQRVSTGQRDVLNSRNSLGVDCWQSADLLEQPAPEAGGEQELDLAPYQVITLLEG
jgi:alpha-mannosidase